MSNTALNGDAELNNGDYHWKLERKVHSRDSKNNLDTSNNSNSSMSESEPRRLPGSALVITRQPGSQEERFEDDLEWKTWNASSIMNGLSHSFDLSVKRPTGLGSIAVSETILVEAVPNTWKCDWDMKYRITDEGFAESNLMFTAIEELQCCSFGSLQNIVIRDPDNQPVARVCYKEKSCLSGKLVLAVYAPADLLVGTGEEFSHFGICCSPRFQLRNSDGEKLFIVEYNQQVCCGPGKFQVISNSGGTESAKILFKTQKAIKINFPTKTSLTLKIILLGFCIAILHKCYSQGFDEPTVLETGEILDS